MYITNIKYLCLRCRVTECGMNGKYGIQDNKTHPKQLGRKDTRAQLAAAISPYMSSLYAYFLHDMNDTRKVDHTTGELPLLISNSSVGSLTFA